MLYHAAGGTDDMPRDIPPSTKPTVLQKSALEFLGWVKKGTAKPTRRIHPPAFEGEEDEELTQVWGDEVLDEQGPQAADILVEFSDEPPQGDEELIFYSEDDNEEELEDEVEEVEEEEEDEEEEMTLVELRKARTAARVIVEDVEEPGVMREEEQAPGSVPTSPNHPQGGEETSNHEEGYQSQGQEVIPGQEQIGQEDTAPTPQLPESEHTPEERIQGTDIEPINEHNEVLAIPGSYGLEAPQVEIIEDQLQQQLVPIGEGIEPSQILLDISSSAPAEPSREHTRVITPYSQKRKESMIIHMEAPKQPRIPLETTLRVLQTLREAKKDERKKKAQERAKKKAQERAEKKARKEEEKRRLEEEARKKEEEEAKAKEELAAAVARGEELQRSGKLKPARS